MEGFENNENQEPNIDLVDFPFICRICLKRSDSQLFKLEDYLMNLYLSITKINKKRVRTCGVRPINRKRKTEGFFSTLIKSMRTEELDGEQFFKFTRMTKNQFMDLLRLVGPNLQKNVKKYHIPPEHRLLITIHYLAEGCSMQEVAWGFRIGHATAHIIIKETCKVLWEVLSPSQLPVPSRSDWELIATEFFNRWNLPNCIGALDGKHVVIRAPPKSGSVFFNYKKSFSIVLMATCDAHYRFTTVDIGAAGSNHDSAVFKLSGLGEALMQGKLNIPPPRNLPGTNIKMPYFLVADSAFPLHENIIRPFAGNNLGEKENICNYRISRARRTIESTFGILSQRWRILLRPIQASLEVSELIVQACVVLHNTLQTIEKDLPPAERKYCPTGYVDQCNNEGEVVPGSNLRSVRRLGSQNTKNIIKAQRNTLADYFISNEGKVPWQEDYILRGAVPLS